MAVNRNRAVKFRFPQRLISSMLPNLEAPEIVFGLCSPIGTNNKKVSGLISTILMKYSYKSSYFKVTDIMKDVAIKGMSLDEKPVEKRYDTHIKYANKLRDLIGFPSALAMMCCAAVRAHRRKERAKPNSYLPSNAYIFDQFKRKEEIEALRQVYGRLFILVSIYSDKEIRIQHLSERIAEDHAVSRPTGEHENLAKELVQRDEDEEGVPNGQRFRDAFPLADLFINIDDPEGAEKAIERFLQAFFGSNKISPTHDEYGMYIAKSAALRSLDLSRQVGAAIFSQQGEVVTQGCNEVPKAGGGTYWADDPTDTRDYILERDENERIKRSLLADVVRRLAEGKFIDTDKTDDELVNFVLDEAARKGSILREAQLMDLLEFGRIIHAEMSAISDAARLGRSIKDTFLYCTTFPCHICAKHIVAAGIKKVVYIEPYPKSYAEQLHRDSITVQAGDYKGAKTQFSPFIGISPFRFREVFERGRRKDAHGKFSEWADGRPRPVVRYTVATYLENETALTKIFSDRMKLLVQQGLVSVSSDNANRPRKAAKKPKP